MYENIKKIKSRWYNFVLDKPLKGGENVNIQYIIKIDGCYGIASMKPLNIKDIDNINLAKWIFRPFNEIVRN